MALFERPDGAHEIAASRQLDLDHLGAEVAQQRGREWRGDARADVENADAGERERHRAKRNHRSTQMNTDEVSEDPAPPRVDVRTCGRVDVLRYLTPNTSTRPHGAGRNNLWLLQAIALAAAVR